MATVDGEERKARFGCAVWVHRHQSPVVGRAGWRKNVDKFLLVTVLRPFGRDLELLLRRSSYQKGRAIYQI